MARTTLGRTRSITVRLTPEDAATLADIARRRRGSQADVVEYWIRTWRKQRAEMSAAFEGMAEAPSVDWDTPAQTTPLADIVASQGVAYDKAVQ